MTTNEAAESLRGFLEFKGYARHASLIEEALAIERVRAVSEHQALCDERVKEHGDAVRRATVERIREQIPKQATRPEWRFIRRVLDEEAAR